MTDNPLKAAAQRVQDALAAKGLDLEVRQFPATTRSAAEAAAVIGCDVAQIAKSLIFRAVARDAPVLVIASGVNRVDETKVSALLGEEIGRADADLVRRTTGYAIGGVPPVGHATPPVVLLDADLLKLEEIWAAAGTPNAVFRLTPEDLLTLTEGRVAEIKPA